MRGFSDYYNGGRKKVLFICGSINQTTMMHQISEYMPDCDCRFTPYYADGLVDALARNGALDFSILGGSFKRNTFEYLRDHNLKVDYYGSSGDYDLALTCSDLIVPKNVRNKKLVLVQEGMTDPKNLGYYLVKWLNFPGYYGGTSSTGLSDHYNVFCVASEGYKELFSQNGVDPEKIKVTGIPNYDDCKKYETNSFPHKGFVLVATSDARETMKFENRKAFIQRAVKIAAGRQLIFKLHPNEIVKRATKEINKWAPDALVYSTGNIHEMIANCEVLITKFSTTVYTGIALGKEVYSEFDLDKLRRLSPMQNGGTSARNIAEVCRDVLDNKYAKRDYRLYRSVQTFKTFQPQKSVFNFEAWKQKAY